MTNSRPNIIYLFSDQHRHDAMGCAGNPVIQTPNLDKMASEGVRFSRTYCQSPICQPSRASVITGLYTHQHGIPGNIKSFDPAWPTMMKRLKDRGYYTAEFGKTHFECGAQLGKVGLQPSNKIGLDLRENEAFIRSFGFDEVMEEFDRYAHAMPNVKSHYTEYLREKGRLEAYRDQIKSVWRLTPNHWDAQTSVLPQEDDLTAFTADRAIDWLNGYKGEQPFFMMVSFVAPHVPLIADPIWAEYYQEAQIPRGPRIPPTKPNDVWGARIDDMHKHSQSQLLTDEYVLNGARQYYGMVSLIDQRIGDIIRAVEEKGWADNTYLVYSADHGEMLGDHNLMAKMQFYKSSVLVPAIIRPPHGMAAKVVDGITESIDLTASILDIAGAEPIEDSWARSLLHFLEGNRPGRDVAFSAIQRGRTDSDYYYVMAATERYRLTIEARTDTDCELFDLYEDPDEENNLVNDPGYQGIIEDIRKDYLQSYLALGKI